MSGVAEFESLILKEVADRHCEGFLLDTKQHISNSIISSLTLSTFYLPAICQLFVETVTMLL